MARGEITLKDAAAALGISRQAVWQKVRRGILVLTPAGVERYRRWRESGQTGTPPGCANDMRVKDYARAMGILPNTIYHWLAMEQIPGAHRHGNNWYIPWTRATGTP